MQARTVQAEVTQRHADRSDAIVADDVGREECRMDLDLLAEECNAPGPGRDQAQGQAPGGASRFRGGTHLQSRQEVEEARIAELGPRITWPGLSSRASSGNKEVPRSYGKPAVSEARRCEMVGRSGSGARKVRTGRFGRRHRLNQHGHGDGAVREGS